MRITRNIEMIVWIVLVKPLIATHESQDDICTLGLLEAGEGPPRSHRLKELSHYSDAMIPSIDEDRLERALSWGVQQGGTTRGYNKGVQQGGTTRGYNKGVQQGGTTRGYNKGVLTTPPQRLKELSH